MKENFKLIYLNRPVRATTVSHFLKLATLPAGCMMEGGVSGEGGEVVSLRLLFPLCFNDVVLTTKGDCWLLFSSKLLLRLLRPFRKDLMPGMAVSRGSAILERGGRREFALKTVPVGDACGTVKDDAVVVLEVVTIRRPRGSNSVACSATFPVINTKYIAILTFRRVFDLACSSIISTVSCEKKESK